MNGRRNQQGSALIVVLVLIMILSGLSAFMLTGAFQKATAADLIVENSKSLQVAEAGIDRTLQAINNNINLTVVDSVTQGVLGTEAARINCGSGDYYIAHFSDWSHDGIDNDSNGQTDDLAEKFYYTVRCVARGDINGNPNLARRRPIEKTVEVIVKRLPFSGFAKAMFGKDRVVLGGTVFTDSYDTESSLGPTYAAQAVNTDPHTGVKLIARYKGDVGSNGPIGDVGTVDVFGNSTAGPGYSTTITSNCFIFGSTAPSPTPVPLPTVPCDAPAGTPPVPNNGTTADTLTNSVTLAGGTYRCAAISLGNKQQVDITGNVTLYVDGSIDLTAKEELRITGTGKLTIYQKSGGVKIVGGSNTNASGKPGALVVFSETTSDINVGGNSTFAGCVYAPKSSVKLAGNTTYFGSVTGGEIVGQGTMDFHYDEALGRMEVVVAGPCQLKAWREIVQQ